MIGAGAAIIAIGALVFVLAGGLNKNEIKVVDLGKSTKILGRVDMNGEEKIMSKK